MFQVTYTVHTQKNLVWQVGDVLIEAGSPIQAGGSRAFVLIEAGGLYLVMDDFKISKLDRFRFDFLKKI